MHIYVKMPFLIITNHCNYIHISYSYNYNIIRLVLCISQHAFITTAVKLQCCFLDSLLLTYDGVLHKLEGLNDWF